MFMELEKPNDGLMVPTDRCPYELAAFGPQREFTNATSEFGDVRMTVCRSTLASDSGEIDSARFLLNFSIERGVEKQDASPEPMSSDPDG